MALPIAPNNQAIGSAMSAAPMSATPQAAQTSLPANYQDARNAFQQFQTQEMENYRNAPYDPNRAIPGIGVAMIGNDQFGQQFGSATDADAFDRFYNANYANLAPMPQQPGDGSGFTGGSTGTAPPNPTTGGGLTSAITNRSTINNPLSMTIPGSVPNFAAIPDLGITAGSAPGGGGLTQGTALPNITTVQKQATATPTFYTDYLNQLAKQGASAAQNAQFVGPTALQNQAFDLTRENVGSYNPALDAASNLATQAGAYNAAEAAGRYMNPYTQSVVDELGRVGRSNIEKYLAPAATSAAVGSGQFGSKRGAEVLGQAINTGLSNLNLAQSQALQTGYSQALAAAQQEQQARLAGSQRFSDIANQRQALGLGDINAAATIGEQQRALEQNYQLFPMQQLTSQAALLRGQTIPTSTSSSYTGPIPGAYNASPLSQIAGLGALAKEVPNLFSSIGTGIEKLAAGPVGAAVNKGFNALVGGPSGKTIAYQQTLADGSTMNVASDGTKTIMFEDGRVQNFDRAGNLLPSGTVDPASPPPSDGMTEQGLYDQEAIYQDFQDYSNYYPYVSDDYYNPYDDAGY